MKFLSCMPKSIQSHLMSAEFPTAEKMAAFADNIVGTSTPHSFPSPRLEAVFEEPCVEDAVQATSRQKNPPPGPVLLPPEIRPSG